MTDFEYQIRVGKLEDALKIWQIRNSFLSRQNSNEQQEIRIQNHRFWFKNKYFTGKKNKLLVITVNSGVVGYLRFDLNKDTYVIAIALDPDYRGQGLGFALLKEGLMQADTSIPLNAQIKKNNLPSIKLFQKCGFKILNEDVENYYLKYEK